MELGKRQTLTVLRNTGVGFYLGEEEDGEAVLLPRKECPEDARPGDLLEVFLYKDSEDRLIATRAFPALEVGTCAVLPVSQITNIGAFLDWGLLKDLLLPFKEQKYELKPGDKVPVILYVDRSSRLCASMKIYNHLSNQSPYVKDDTVSGMVYEVKEELGAFIAVDNRYYGMIPSQELYLDLRPGDTVEARVLKVRKDGKLDLSPRKKAYAQMDRDAELVWNTIRSYDGHLPFNDRADAELIKREFGLSKNAFKRAVGRLLKTGFIEITDSIDARVPLDAQYKA